MIIDKDSILDLACALERGLSDLHLCLRVLEDKLEMTFGLTLGCDLHEELTSEKPVITLRDEHDIESVRITITENGYIEGTLTYEKGRGSWVNYGYGSCYEAHIVEEDIIFDEALLTLIENTRMLANVIEGVRCELQR